MNTEPFQIIVKNSHIRLNRLPLEARRQIDRIDLPANYLAAKAAIKECADIDQLREIGNRYTAIAAYAKQIKDTSLRDAARRIELRARIRLGELFLEIADPKDRNEIMRVASINHAERGFSEMLARVPTDRQEELIERSPPAKGPEFRAHDPRYRERRQGLRELVPADLVWKRINEFSFFISTLGISAKEAARTCPLDEYAQDELNRDRKIMLEVIDWLDEYELHYPLTVKRA